MKALINPIKVNIHIGVNITAESLVSQVTLADKMPKNFQVLTLNKVQLTKFLQVKRHKISMLYNVEGENKEMLEAALTQKPETAVYNIGLMADDYNPVFVLLKPIKIYE